MIGPIIIPGKTATFNDFLNFQRESDPLKDFEKIKDIEDTGNLGPIAGAIANIQVMEIFKYLTGKGELNLNKFAEIDFLNFNFEWRNFK
jgi:molybdopterin/thiamine biosynthesis adenylyltransferase